MQHLTLVPRLSVDDLQTVLDRCTQEDAAELRAAGLPRHVKTFTPGMEHARVLGAVWSHSGPVAAFGCIPHDADASIGIPWMIATPQLRMHPREAMALSLQQIGQMKATFDWLYNLVHCEHATAIRWLQWLGFHVEHQNPRGPGGVFLPFSWSKFNV